MIPSEPTSSAPSQEDLEQIGRFSRRPLSPDELYIFPLVLCDNEIDRDGEKFSIDALQTLCSLFLGKTGIFDHVPRGENQTARIYNTAVSRDPDRLTADGEIYHALTANAYMVRSERNRDLILDIEAGIKKEVSVGCATARAVCSICGRDVREQPCNHTKGRVYEGATCFHILEQPTDAYEWSFVAVPSQPAAGVTKSAAQGYLTDAQSLEDMLQLLLEHPEGVYLTPGDIRLLANAAAALEQRARDGDQCREQLAAEVLRAATLAGCSDNRKAIASITDKLNVSELRTLKKAFSSSLPALPNTMQLGAPAQSGRDNCGDFRF